MCPEKTLHGKIITIKSFSFLIPLLELLKFLCK